MGGLTLKLLGVPEVLENGRAVTAFRSTKTRALLYYVATKARPEARSNLAGLFWGELPDANANANLRKTLTNLRQSVGPYLAITRDSVGLNEANPLWLDVAAFEAALQRNVPTDLETAVDLYRGDFLEGFYVEGAPAFETWLLAERYRLREQLLLALHTLAKVYAGRRQLARAIRHAQHLLGLEPLREDAHRLLMSLFAENGQRARALAQYEACAKVLAEELEVEPAEETTALLQQIRDGTFTPAQPTPAVLAPRHNLPAPTTSFVGRERELARIERWLAEPTSRLLTIVGPGGVGKTRLAQQAARNAVDRFADGVWTVSLASLEDAANTPTAVAATMGITFFGEAGPEAQVIRYLHRKRLLLVLDNAEHLLSQAFADFLMEILTQAPAVTIIVSSRQRLEMQAEQVLDLPGLAYPDEEVAVSGSAYPAGQLFLQRAEGHGYALPAAPQRDEAVYRLCRLVDGLPLALELAAAWTPTMSPAEILDALERGLDFLATNVRDIPPRHRSMRAVFDRSWEMLGADERRVLRQLAYFRGGFSADAAARVVGTTAEQLQGLVNKSLVRAHSGDRYDMHELIRHYAASKLAQHPDEAEALARGHGRYFAAFLAAREETIRGAYYLQAKAEIEAEVDNVRQAWEWAVAAHSAEDIARSAETLHYYFLNTQGLFGEAAQRFQRAAAQIAEHVEHEGRPLVGRLLLKAAANRRMVGQLEEASRLVEESLAIFYRHELAADVIRATSTLGVIRLQQNDKEKALRLAETAVAQARELDAPVDLCLCLNNLAYVLAHNGKHEAAAAIAEESAALAQDIAYSHGALSAMNMLGVYYQQIGEMEKAEAIFEKLVARCRETATRSRLAQAINNLGALYKKRGDLNRALPLLQEALSLYDAVGQLHYANFVKVMLGELSLEQGNLELAQRHCQQALQAAVEIEMPALALSAFALHAQLLLAQGEHDNAVSILALVAHHPATGEDTKEEVRRAVRPLRETMTPQSFTSAWNRGLTWTLDELLRKGPVSSSLFAEGDGNA